MAIVNWITIKYKRLNCHLLSLGQIELRIQFLNKLDRMLTYNIFILSKRCSLLINLKKWAYLGAINYCDRDWQQYFIVTQIRSFLFFLLSTCPPIHLSNLCVCPFTFLCIRFSWNLTRHYFLWFLTRPNYLLIPEIKPDLHQGWDSPNSNITLFSTIIFF
jgi:hypothetical protein